MDYNKEYTTYMECPGASDSVIRSIVVGSYILNQVKSNTEMPFF